MTDDLADTSRMAILAILNETGWSATELAKRAGLSPTTLTRFLNDDTHTYALSARTMAKVMKVAPNIPPEQRRMTISFDEDEVVRVPVYDIRAAAGDGALAGDESAVAYQPYRAQELARISRSDIEQLAVIQVAGDSMWETLHDGDKVLVDRSVRRIVRDGIYVLGFEGELLVKRCQRDLETGEVIVRSDNERYQSFRISEADVLQVVGRVIWIGRALG